MARVAKTDEEIKAIAKDIVLGNVFSTLALPPSDLSMINIIFMPITFGAFAGYTREQLDEIGSIYEYLSEALPTGVNGYPIFGSMQILSTEETDKLRHFIRNYAAAMENV